MEPSSSAHSSQMCGFRSLILLDFFCHIQRISSTADLIAVGLNVSAGNSSDRSYLFTTPKVLIVCAGVPSSHLARTVWPSEEKPLSRISLHIFTNNLSALLITFSFSDNLESLKYYLFQPFLSALQMKVSYQCFEGRGILIVHSICVLWL